MFDFLSIFSDFIINFIDAGGYLGLFLLMVSQGCGIPIPSEIVIPFSGFLVATGEFSFWMVVLIGTLGNFVGSIVAYWLGYKGGRTLLTKYGKYIFISRKDMHIGDRWFKKRGELSVFVGRFLPIVRTYVSFPAGIAKMHFGKFCLYTLLGFTPWCILFVWLGMKMQGSWENILQKLEPFNLLILGLIVLWIGWYIWGHIKKNKKHKK